MNLIFDFLWVLVTLAAVILVVVVVILVTLAVRNGSQSKLEAPSRTPDSSGTKPALDTPAERLRALAARRASRQITLDEYAAAREEILRDL